ncbi:AAA-ATPase-like protein [Tanacetum coccineum]
MKKREENVKIFTFNPHTNYANTSWFEPVDLDRPSTFSTLAMDTYIKEKVKNDLDSFVASRDYYLSVGKARKRGYVLTIKFNKALRSLWVATERSIVVVEDIDYLVELHDRESAEHRKGLARDNHHSYRKEGQQVNLFEFLELIDGLWSSSDDEKIIIFTTNVQEKLDLESFYPGLMDVVDINMLNCTPWGFRLLASKHLGITDHNLFGNIDDLIRKVKITPTEVAEKFLNDDDPDISLSRLIDFFDVKKQNERKRIGSKRLTRSKKSKEGSVMSNYLISEIGSRSYSFLKLPNPPPVRPPEPLKLPKPLERCEPNLPNPLDRVLPPRSPKQVYGAGGRPLEYQYRGSQYVQSGVKTEAYEEAPLKAFTGPRKRIFTKGRKTKPKTTKLSTEWKSM